MSQKSKDTLQDFIRDRDNAPGSKWSWGTTSNKSQQANSLEAMCDWDERMAETGRKQARKKLPQPTGVSMAAREEECA